MSTRLTKKRSRKKSPKPTGIEEIDSLADRFPCTIHDYVIGASTYVRQSHTLAAGPKKAAQIRLSNALSRALAAELTTILPRLGSGLVTDEQKIAGGLRTANADLSESHSLDGLRLAVELKPINLAVGRAIWNRFGDIRTFAVNIHLKFPFAVVGGVLAIPTYEEIGTKAAKKAEALEEVLEEGSESLTEMLEGLEPDAAGPDTPTPLVPRKSTTHLIERAIDRLIRAGGRKSEADPSHLLEGIAVLVYDPDTGSIDPSLPEPGSGLRWEEFVATLAASYRARFED
jgi:hypothetical protein